MKKNKLCIFFSMLIAITFSACEADDPMASEQYRKEIYIVGAYNNVLSFDLPYGENQDAFISLAVSGTLKIDRDVNITLKHDDDIISWYNDKYMLDAPVKYQQLEPGSIHIPSWTTTIKAGEIYAHLPFTVSSTGLHCDSLYAVTFTIESVSDYMGSGKDTTLILTLNLTNEFSGVYQMEAAKTTLVEDEEGQWSEIGLPVPVVTLRTLTAVSADTVRFFHEKEKETLSEYSNSWNPGEDYFNAINNFCIQFGKVAGTNTFTVEPWGVMDIIDGEAIFSNNIFTFWYDYMQGTTRYRMKGTFRK